MLFTFPKKKRLLQSRQFRRVNKYGRSFSGKLLAINICESKRSSLKMGLTVPKKFGNAVQRNRFKRLVREAFRLSQHQLPDQLHLNIRPLQEQERFFSEKPTLEIVQEELARLCSLAINETWVKFSN